MFSGTSKLVGSLLRLAPFFLFGGILSSFGDFRINSEQSNTGNCQIFIPTSVINAKLPCNHSLNCIKRDNIRMVTNSCACCMPWIIVNIFSQFLL